MAVAVRPGKTVSTRTPFGLTSSRRPSATVGATNTLARRHGDWWVTVVGDVPMPTLRLFAEGLERTKR